MEHVTIKDLGNGFYELTPEDGYMLKNKINGNLYSEAVTKEPMRFVAVAVAALEEAVTVLTGA